MNNIKKIVLLSLIGVSLFSGRVAFAQADSTATSDVNVSFGTETMPLRINSATPFDFGNQTITVLEQTYPAVAPVNVSLTDNRGFDVSNGWELTATLNPFTKDGESSLNGAYMTLENPSSIGQSDQFTPPSMGSQDNSMITLNADSETTVATAIRTDDPSVGVGQWNINWDASDIGLTVLNNTASPGNHSTTVEWQLKDVPLSSN